MTTLAIIGASGHGKVVADMAQQLGWEKIVFFDDAWPDVKNVMHWKVIGKSDSILIDEYEHFFVAIGSNKVRKKKIELLKGKEKKLPNLIHPSAFVSTYSKIGSGVLITENVVIKISSIIGDGVVINSNSVVGHDCVISDFSHITPNCAIAGNVFIGELSWVGNGSSIRQNINIGSNVIVGTGAVVVKDIPADTTVVGNPAKPI
ncbi:TPA: acetyltransferase [Vibrio diabolicus]